MSPDGLILDLLVGQTLCVFMMDALQYMRKRISLQVLFPNINQIATDLVISKTDRDDL
jgi:hypothetical protein